MISRKLRLVITFSSTTDALLLEQSCKVKQISGGLIPVPRMISASCGLAWSTDVNNENSKMITEDFIHIMTRAMFESMFEVVRHKMPKDTAVKYMKMLERYHYAGWDTIMKFNE